MTFSRTLLFAGAIALLIAPSAPAALVYYDDFDGDGLGGLHGTTPDVSTTGATWEAGAAWGNDGVVAIPGHSGANLDLPLVAGKKYIAEATIMNDRVDWIAFGFTVGDYDFTSTSSQVRHSNGGAQGAVWMLTRNHSSANDQEGFKGAATSTPQSWNGNVVDPTEPVKMKVILDNTGPNSVGSFYLNDVLQSTTTFGGIVLAPAGGIGFSHTSGGTSGGTPGSVSDFSLHIVPEPSSAALCLLAVMGVGPVCSRKRWL